MTVTPVDTVQHCKLFSPDPDMPPGVYFRLENTECEMGPELDKLKTSSAGTGFKRPYSSVPRTKGYRSKDEPPPTVS